MYKIIILFLIHQSFLMTICNFFEFIIVSCLLYLAWTPFSNLFTKTQKIIIKSSWLLQPVIQRNFDIYLLLWEEDLENHMGRVKLCAYLSYPIVSEVEIQHFDIISNTLDKMTILMPPPWELCFLFETILESLVWKKMKW